MAAKAVQQIAVDKHNSNILAWQMISDLIKWHRPVRTIWHYTNQINNYDNKYNTI